MFVNNLKKAVANTTEGQRWKHRVDLYKLIQSLCNLPAYFWHHYTLKNNEGISSIQDAINAGKADFVYTSLHSGEIDPQQFCDSRQ
jgi:hypothetical protein